MNTSRFLFESLYLATSKTLSALIGLWNTNFITVYGTWFIISTWFQSITQIRDFFFLLLKLAYEIYKAVWVTLKLDKSFGVVIDLIYQQLLIIIHKHTIRCIVYASLSTKFCLACYTCTMYKILPLCCVNIFLKVEAKTMLYICFLVQFITQYIVWFL